MMYSWTLLYLTHLQAARVSHRLCLESFCAENAAARGPPATHGGSDGHAAERRRAGNAARGSGTRQATEAVWRAMAAGDGSWRKERATASGARARIRWVPLYGTMRRGRPAGGSREEA